MDRELNRELVEALDDAYSALVGLHIATGKRSETAEKAIAKAANVLRKAREDHPHG